MEQKAGPIYPSSAYHFFCTAMSAIGQWQAEATDGSLEASETHTPLSARIDNHPEDFMGELTQRFYQMFADVGIVGEIGYSGVKRDDQGKFRTLYLNLPNGYTLPLSLESLKNTEQMEASWLWNSAYGLRKIQRPDNISHHTADHYVMHAEKLLTQLRDQPWEEDDFTKTVDVSHLTPLELEKVSQILLTAMHESGVFVKFTTYESIDENQPPGVVMTMLPPEDTVESTHAIQQKLESRFEAICFNVKLHQATRPHTDMQSLNMRRADSQRLFSLSMESLKQMAERKWTTKGSYLVASAVLPEMGSPTRQQVMRVVSQWMKNSLVFDDYDSSIRMGLYPDPENEDALLTRIDVVFSPENEKEAKEIPVLFRKAYQDDIKQKPRPSRRDKKAPPSLYELCLATASKPIGPTRM